MERRDTTNYLFGRFLSFFNSIITTTTNSTMHCLSFNFILFYMFYSFFKKYLINLCSFLSKFRCFMSSIYEVYNIYLLFWVMVMHHSRIKLCLLLLLLFYNNMCSWKLKKIIFRFDLCWFSFHFSQEKWGF